MEIIFKKKLLRCIKIAACIMSVCVSRGISADQISLNFNSLFPATWYQKGLESTVKVWHTIARSLENGSSADRKALLLDDVLVGRLAFGQFCVECMRNQDQQPLDEDVAYFVAVINKIKSLLTMMLVVPIQQDRMYCVATMLEKMQKILVPSYKPSDI
jgi:hypothetical protein